LASELNQHKCSHPSGFKHSLARGSKKLKLPSIQRPCVKPSLTPLSENTYLNQLPQWL
jgi:hypothetical protein